MHYRAAPWLIDHAHHPELVEELEGLGLIPAGCLVLDNGKDTSLAWTEPYDEGASRYFLENAERPEPILVTPDATVTVEVSDWHGGPSMRVRTVMADGALVETKLRWPCMPPWPRKMQRAVRLTSLETEMTRHAADGRSIVIADGSPAQVLARHRDHVRRVERERTTVAVPLGSLDDVVDMANTAFKHAEQVETASILVVGMAHMVAGVVALALVGLALWQRSFWLLGLVLPVAALAWWGSVPLVVLARRWRRIRPPFPWTKDPRSRVLTPGA
ncbi:hypothetical protein [Phycicoccus sp. Root101]|uniref:hypothetical protein n=1 Tax=Phycicoccus sp. Root101 TaxID=1736421 RepID=UPI00070282CD|nr:hypothetical protein [Phycicoccus sp. Root101]KQU69211.1 hypothetical protein ASC58_04690 [Phycicoccus sp. Root101]